MYTVWHDAMHYSNRVLIQGWRKQFYIGQVNTGQFFEYVGKGMHPRHTVCSYCTISMQILVGVGHASQENLKATDVLSLNLGAFQGLS